MLFFLSLPSLNEITKHHAVHKRNLISERNLSSFMISISDGDFNSADTIIEAIIEKTRCWIVDVLCVINGKKGRKKKTRCSKNSPEHGK